VARRWLLWMTSISFLAQTRWPTRALCFLPYPVTYQIASCPTNSNFSTITQKRYNFALETRSYDHARPPCPKIFSPAFPSFHLRKLSVEIHSQKQSFNMSTNFSVVKSLPSFARMEVWPSGKAEVLTYCSAIPI